LVRPETGNGKEAFMKNVALALFVLWFLSLHYYLVVPAALSVLLGAAFVATASVTLAGWLSRRRPGVDRAVDRAGSLGL
jgi:hypothetical protein